MARIPEYDDIARQLDKVEDTLQLCLKNLGRQSESWAALHCNDNVMYSPLYSRVGAALEDLAALRFVLTNTTAPATGSNPPQEASHG